MLSILGFGSADAYVPGINNIINGGYTFVNKDGEKVKSKSLEQRIASGKDAIAAFREFKTAHDNGDSAKAAAELKTLNSNFGNFGYGYLQTPEQAIPHIGLTFYSFHIMVLLGVFFILMFLLATIYITRNSIARHKWFLWVGLWSIPLAYVASEAGWIVSEVGRQPWVIQDIMPSMAAVSRISTGSVIMTFTLFAVIFTLLLIAEIRIMLNVIKKGPEGE